MVTPAEIEAGGTSWMLLDPAEYPAYVHPAYYNLSSHFAVDSSGAPHNGWMLVAHTSPDSGNTSPDDSYGSPQGDSDTLPVYFLTSGQIEYLTDYSDEPEGYYAVWYYDSETCLLYTSPSPRD